MLNAAEDYLQVLLGVPGTIISLQQMQARSSSMKLLPPVVQSCLHNSGLTWADLGKIACVRGPGTFTGIRVALALGLGLARGANLALAGLDYLRLLAFSVLGLLQGRLWVLTYARRDLVYMQGFAAPDGDELGGPACVQRSQAAARIRDYPGQAYALGSALFHDADFWQENLPGVVILDKTWNNPRAEVLLEQALQAEPRPASIEPAYLRPSDAEADLARIAEQRGLSLGQARKIVQGAAS